MARALASPAAALCLPLPLRRRRERARKRRCTRPRAPAEREESGVSQPWSVGAKANGAREWTAPARIDRARRVGQFLLDDFPPSPEARPSMPKPLSLFLWVLVAAAGAGSLAWLALSRGGKMSAAWLLITAVCSYLTGYRVFSCL